jgi:4-hydroxy-3-polyprenylbenzoate decarboxylase
MIEYNDLREWINQAEKIGELKNFEGVDPHLELGGIVQINSKNEGPALLFSALKGYQKNFKILTNVISNMKLFNLTFGLPVSNSLHDTINTLRIKANEWEDKAKDFPVQYVEKGPLLENVKEGNSIDLEKFPVPLWHDKDGGKYIGTGVGVITKDPDTGALNMGTYRVQLHDRHSVGFYISPGKHGRVHRDKYFAKGEACPVVMIFGFDPLEFAAGAAEVPSGVFEYDYLGAIRNKPVQVIKAKATGLPIPVNAEIAVEGFSYPNESKLEGPFGEWTGTYGSEAREEPFVKVSTLYYRNDPIILGSPPSKGVYFDSMLLRCVWRSALLYNEIERAGVLNVKGVWCPPFGGAREFIVVSIKQSYPGHATQAGLVASQTRAGAYAGRYVVVVDDDINPYDMDDVLWAMCTRSEPLQMDLIKKAWSTPLDPIIRKPTDCFCNSRGIIYAVKPYEWFDKFPPTSLADESERIKLFEKWNSHMADRWKTF